MLTEREYREKREQYGQAFKAAMGAEAVKQLLDNVDLDGEVAQLKEELKTASGQKRTRAIRRLDILEAFRASGNQPLDGNGCYPSYSTRFTSDGSIGRWSFCNK